MSGNPGDRVEAPLADEGTREPTSTGSMAPSSPALLEQYLALPRSRLIVDGYNVTKTTWPTLSLEAQRARLLALLLRAGRAHQRRDHGGLRRGGLRDAARSWPHRAGSRCCSAPSASSPTTCIRELVAAEPAGRVVVVVTEDRELADDVRRDGARVVAPGALTRVP